MNHRTILRAAVALALLSTPAVASAEPLVDLAVCEEAVCATVYSSTNGTDAVACAPRVDTGETTCAGAGVTTAPLMLSQGGSVTALGAWYPECKTDVSGYAVGITATISGSPHNGHVGVRCSLYVDGVVTITVPANLPTSGGMAWNFGKDPNTMGKPWCVALQAWGPNGEHLDTADCPRLS